MAQDSTLTCHPPHPRFLSLPACPVEWNNHETKDHWKKIRLYTARRHNGVPLSLFQATFDEAMPASIWWKPCGAYLQTFTVAWKIATRGTECGRWWVQASIRQEFYMEKDTGIVLRWPSINKHFGCTKEGTWERIEPHTQLQRSRYKHGLDRKCTLCTYCTLNFVGGCVSHISMLWGWAAGCSVTASLICFCLIP